MAKLLPSMETIIFVIQNLEQVTEKLKALHLLSYLLGQYPIEGNLREENTQEKAI